MCQDRLACSATLKYNSPWKEFAQAATSERIMEKYKTDYIPVHSLETGPDAPKPEAVLLNPSKSRSTGPVCKK